MFSTLFSRRPGLETAVARAKKHVRKAIVELDNAGAPGDIAAHLDHATAQPDLARRC